MDSARRVGQSNVMEARRVHFLLHVPKCAGTTVEAHFRRHLGPDFLIAPRWENPLRDVVGNRYPVLSAEQIAQVRVVSGHSLSTGLRRHFPGAEILESVLLRDPVGYFLSFYNYRWARHRQGFGSEPPAFARWYGAQRRNPISRFLLNRYFEQGVPTLYRLSSRGRLNFLEKRLAGFHFVGDYRQADVLIGEISRALGLPGEITHENVTPARQIAPEELQAGLRDRILEENAVDLTLYERWADRAWHGAPSSPCPRLSTMDHGRYLIGDAYTGVVKKLIA